MARSFLTAINLNKNELQNAAVQNLGSAPASPVKGQLYYNSTGGDDTLYWWNGSQWIAAKAAAGAIPAATVTTQAVGDAPVVGVSTNYAREDHKHGREAFGNVIAVSGFGQGSANGGALTVARSDHFHGTPTHDNAAHSAVSISALASPTAPLNMGNWPITNLPAPSSSSDAANKGYVDNSVAGLSWKDAVRLATTGSAAMTGLPVIDGVQTVVGDRILVKNNLGPETHGIYLASSTAWGRAQDADVAIEIEGMAVFVMEGTVNADTAWVCTANAPITVGTTPLVFAQFAGGGTVTAGAGMTQTGNTLNVIAGDTSLTVAADDVRVNTSVIASVASLAGYVPTTRQVIAGAGLVTGGPLSSDVTVDVGAGTGITVTANAVAVNGGVVAYWSALSYAANVGGATSQVINHALLTQDVIVSVYRNSAPFDVVDCDVECTDINNVTLRFATAPATNAYRAVIMAKAF